MTRHYKLQFTKTWDKLKPNKFTVGTHLTTFRAYIPWLVRNYQQMKKDNAEAIVFLNRQPIGCVSLDNMDYTWSDKLNIDFIKKDTFSHWSRHDWEQFIKKTYGIYPVFGVTLDLTVTKAEVEDKKQIKLI